MEEENIEQPQATDDRPPEEIPVPGPEQISEPLNDLNVTNDSNDTMEVHKHPHHITHKKKWGEFLLEFLMIFFAVFCGFLAENLREHLVEKERGMQYIESFYEDLKTDTASISLNTIF